MFYYRAFGVGIASELELEHIENSDETARDVRIVKAELSGLRRTHALEACDRAFISVPAGVVMHWQNVGSVLVSGGNSIEVDFDPSVDISTRTLALTGPPMGVLLEQRGNLVLHGSAVVMESRAVAFLGHKGLGKSTTAAAMAQAGYPVLTDDILSIDVSSVDLAVSPGVPVLKLWPSSTQAIYGPDEEVGDDHTDKHLRRTSVDQGRSVPLGAVFVLDLGDPDAQQSTGKEAFLDLLRNSYAGRFVGTDGTPPDHFLRCTKVASSVPIFRLRRRPALESLPDVVKVVEDVVHNL